MAEFIGKVEAARLADWAVATDPHLWIILVTLLVAGVLGVWIALGRIR
jgi:hypothetical protein